MLNPTREAFNAYLDNIAKLNGVASAATKFAVDPSVEQTLEERIRESSGFLQQINVVTVGQQKGQKLGLDVGSPIASTKDTSGGAKREPTDPTTLAAGDYECTQTNFDTAIAYAKLDMWSKFPDFQTRMRNVVTGQQARDRIMIGWNGASRAASSDKVANPLLQDVNVGWLEHMRVDAPERVIAGLKIGDEAGADFKNMDQAVMAATEAYIADWFADDPDLVAICGRSLISDKYTALAGDHEAPTERAALNTLVTNRQFGGKQAITVPFFPAKGFAITKLANLSVYAQEGTRRRHIKDEPEADRVADYQSVNEAYVVEDTSCMCFVEGILTPDGVGGWE